jgi:hypothetical protein
MAGPRLLVEPPTFTSIPYGLLTVVEYPPTPDQHWENGVTYRSICLATSGQTTGTTYDECISVTGTGAPPAGPSKVDNVDSIFRGATPFTVITEFDCSPVGLGDAEAVAQRALAQSEPWQVERAFWSGIVGGQTVVFPHLAANAQVLDAQSYVLQTAATTVTGGATPLHVVEALGLLEGALADCYDGVGVIHVPQRALPTFDAWSLLHADGDVMRTLNGNKVAIGAGYPGTSPAGAVPTAGSSWIYATGAVMAYRSAVRLLGPPGAIDRAKNTVKMIAERTYVLGWDCCHIAALAAISVPV